MMSGNSNKLVMPGKLQVFKPDSFQLSPVPVLCREFCVR